jgi:hypothetical protein
LAWVSDFGAEPEVVKYAYRYAERKPEHSKNLAGKVNYVGSIVKAWTEKGLRSVDEVTQYLADTDKRHYQYKRVLKALGMSRLATEEEQRIIDSWFNDMRRHTFYDNFADHIPKNGIYIMFENTEKAHRGDRIVRIGTHSIRDNGKSTLEDRLNEHNSPNGRSVFRAKIGDAIINKSRSEGSTFWSEEDLLDWNRSWGKNIPRRRPERFQERGRAIQLEEADKLINEYVRTNITFVCIEIDDRDSRKLFEARLISTVSNCPECQKSEHWPGNFSTKEKVCNSGLWQEKELWKNDFSDTEFSQFWEIVKATMKKYG